MPRANEASSEHGCHPEVWELLPWYVNGTLEGPELERVAARVSSCPSCQEELARCRELAAAIQGEPEPAWSASPGRLLRLHARIDAFERSESERWWSSLRGKIDRWFALTPPTIRWALAAEAMLVVLLAVVVTWQAMSPTRAAYRTLSSETARPSPHGGDLRVVFAGDMTEQELRELLGRLEAQIVDGPSPTGVYTLRLSPAGRAEDQTRIALETLRMSPKVRLAEPAVAAPVPSRSR
jgi:hypothetical protein